MLWAMVAVLAGLVILVWSADRFVDGAASVARHLGMSPLLIGMVIVGFGTSAPEMLVSAISAWQGNPGIAIGNAYGSNITNIALILGFTAVVSPIAISSSVLKKELPLVTLFALVAGFQAWDSKITTLEAVILLLVFLCFMIWTIFEGMRQKDDALSKEMDGELKQEKISQKKAWLYLVIGLVLLLASSRVLVWGAVSIAQMLGVNDLVIGLTVVAVGTSLPELASSIAAARKKESEIVVGNILGSNIFNTLAVVGIAGAIKPIDMDKELIIRDIPVMTMLTAVLFIMGYGFKKAGSISRIEGAILLFSYIAYVSFLIMGTIAKVV
ncbi:MAG: calcium/sodium antiporter [Alphaproteobacteria bacterium]